MTEQSYYIDTCIWLNLFKKEGDESKGIPYWLSAKEFLAQNSQIHISTIVLKELSYKVKSIEETIFFFKNKEFTQIHKTKQIDYDLARKFENDELFAISFYDYLHVAIAKRLNCTLITRDKDLIHFARKHINVYRPEELLT